MVDGDFVRKPNANIKQHFKETGVYKIHAEKSTNPDGFDSIVTSSIKKNPDGSFDLYQSAYGISSSPKNKVENNVTNIKSVDLVRLVGQEGQKDIFIITAWESVKNDLEIKVEDPEKSKNRMDAVRISEKSEDVAKSNSELMVMADADDFIKLPYDADKLPFKSIRVVYAGDKHPTVEFYDDGDKTQVTPENYPIRFVPKKRYVPRLNPKKLNKLINKPV